MIDVDFLLWSYRPYTLSQTQTPRYAKPTMNRSTPRLLNPLFNLSTLNIVSQLLMLRDKETPLRITLPHQHANLTRIPNAALILRQRRKVLKQKARRRLHALVLDLPQADLIYDRGREDGRLASQLRVGVRRQVRYYLVGRDAVLDGAADGVASDAARDHVWVAGGEPGEEGEDGDLEGGGGVGVETVVGFDDYESARATR